METYIEYEGKSYRCRPGETLLDSLLRQGAKLDFSCRKGICHTCVLFAEQGVLPEGCQEGLDTQTREAGGFLPCLCKPSEHLNVTARKRPAAEQLSEGKKLSKPVLPDPELWRALDDGVLLRKILEQFYARVFDDPRLAPFFKDVTPLRAVDKQYLFMRKNFTGEKVYFGDNPRNAHHWMVISDELFAYRESIMVDTLRQFSLPEHLIDRWIAFENSFKPDIVKDRPWKRRVGDIEIPVDGYDLLTLDIGTLCDSCGGEIDAGETIRCHLRLGTLYCRECMN